MAGPRRAAALAAACAVVAQGALGVSGQTTSAGMAGETLAFFATSDWGGQAAAPYTTPLQLAMAEAMGHVSASFHPHFVVSAGGNFLPGGLPGTGVGNTNDQIRVGATFNEVFSPDSLQVPWFITGGTPDWEGNITAEISFNGSSFTNGRWVYPARYHSFTTVVPSGGDTVQVIMIDTESLIGGINHVPIDMPPLYYPPPAAYSAPAVTGTPAATTFLPTAVKAVTATPAPTPVLVNAVGVTPTPVATPWGAGATPSVPTASTQSAQQQAQQALAVANADEVFAPPSVDEAQWNWLEGQLNSSTADWLIVVGYHPVWSVGEYGPTWTLVTRLVPMLQQAGVALYISGMDHLMQHFTPVPQWQNVDYIVVGNGAYASPPGTTAAEAMPHALDCPDGGLQFSFGQTSGFAVVEITTAGTHQPSELHVNFFDSNETMLYSFFKENPRTMPGHIAGDLRSPPAPGRGPGGSGVSYDSKPLAFMGAAFLVVAVLLCLIGAASHARRQLMYLSAMRGARAGGPGMAPGMGPEGGAGGGGGAGEHTPLLMQRGRAYAPPAARPNARKFVA